MEIHLLGLCPKDLGMTWKGGNLILGGPQGVGRSWVQLIHGAPLVPCFHSLGPWEGLHFMWVLGFCCKTTLPLGISYK